jgi:hypothetical protein
MRNFFGASSLEILLVTDLILVLYVWHLWGPYVLDCVFSGGR